MTTINKQYVSRLYYLHHELHKAIEGLARDRAAERGLWSDADAELCLVKMSGELETIFAEALTEDERRFLQMGNRSLPAEAEADITEKIEKLLDDLTGDDE